MKKSRWHWSALACFASLLFLSVCASSTYASSPNRLPVIAEKALNSPESVVLYSLEPYTESLENDKHWKGAKFYHFMCLGKISLTGNAAQTAITEFKNVIPGEAQRMADCFNPRHALSVVSGHHTYDFLLCYECGQMEVCEDGKELATLSAGGSPDVLNDLLKKAGIPLSFVFSDAYMNRTKAGQNKRDADWKRWVEAAPGSLRPFLTNAASAGMTFGNDPEKELARETPDLTKRILALLSWYGSGEGPWSGFDPYEVQPEELLMRYSTAEILSAIQSTSLTDAQLEGAARLFGNSNFSKQRPGDLKLMPSGLKAKLLAHVLQGKNQNNIERAQKAFGRG